MGIADKIPHNTKKILSVYITFFIFLVINIILDPQMLTPTRFSVLAIQYAPLILLAMAQSVIMLTGGIDLSAGNTLSLTACIAAATMSDGFFGVTKSIVLTIACGILIVLIMGVIIVYSRLPAIIVTLAFSYIWKGVTLFVMPVPGGYVPRNVVKFVGQNIFPMGLVIVIAALIFWKFFKNTKYGVALYAIGDNSKAAYVSGIKVNTSTLIAYAISGLFVGIAGVTLTCKVGAGDPSIGVSYQLNSIASSVLGGVAFTGGIGQMKGAVMGAIIINSLLNILFFSGISPFYQYIFQGLILIVAIGLKTIVSMRKDGVDQ